MSNDDAGEKTEQPTPRRRQEAREEGQVARSMDLTAAIALLGALVTLRLLGPYMLEAMLGLTRALGDTPQVSSIDLLRWIKRAAYAAAQMTLPFMALLVVITVAATAAQSGLLLTWKKLALKPERINPVSGFKRLFSGDALSRLAVGLLKIGAVAGVAYLTIAGGITEVLSTGVLDAGGVFTKSSEMLFDLALKLGLVLLALGVLDYAIQRWKLEKQLRMSKQEIRDEMKKMEGDPLLKQRRRQMQQRIAQQRINAEVPRADVVVTNPTHFAVALRYDESAMTAPKVTAKGKDFLAQRIRELAQLHGVPVVQRPPLARALYSGVEVGQEVPPQFYKAVAELLAYAYQVTGRAAG